jgi:hypothetical protein
MPSRAVVWFRGDLRTADHPALLAAPAAADQVVPVFVVDRTLLEGRAIPAQPVPLLRPGLPPAGGGGRRPRPWGSWAAAAAEPSTPAPGTARPSSTSCCGATSTAMSSTTISPNRVDRSTPGPQIALASGPASGILVLLR